MNKKIKKLAYKERRKQKIKDLKIKFIINKYPDLDKNLLWDIYQNIYSQAYSDGLYYERERLSSDNLEITKSFIEGIFLSGVQVGLMKIKNE